MDDQARIIAWPAPAIRSPLVAHRGGSPGLQPGRLRSSGRSASHGRADRRAIAHGESHTQAHGHRYGNGHARAQPDAYPEPHPDGDAKAQPNGDHGPDESPTCGDPHRKQTTGGRQYRRRHRASARQLGAAAGTGQLFRLVLTIKLEWL